MDIDLDAAPGACLSNMNPNQAAAEHVLDDTTSLELFAHEAFRLHLPDPEQDLFIDHSQDPTTFTVFGDLPLEIRLKIWRCIFPPGRSVCIDLLGFDCGMNSALWSKHRNYEYKFHRPITLYISTESRRETLRFYTLMFTSTSRSENFNYKYEYPHHEGPYQKSDLRPMCFSVTRDFLYINDWRVDPTSMFYRWMVDVRTEYKRIAESIESLQIRNIQWRSGHDSIYVHSRKICFMVANPHTNLRSKPLGGLSQLPNLKFLDIPVVVAADVIDREVALARCCEMIETYMNSFKEIFNGGTAPVINVRHAKEK